MAIIKQYHKATDTTYFYESESYWDEEKKQSRSKRHVIGKLDPETGEMIPTGKRGRKKKENAAGVQENPALLQKVRDLTTESAKKDQKIAALEKENLLLKEKLSLIGSLLQKGLETAGTGK